MATASQNADYRAANRAALIEFFRSGAHGAAGGGGMLGVEIEHFLVFDDGAPVPYYPRGGRIGVRDVLEFLAATYPEREFTASGELIGLAGPEGSVTLEPAAQLEISIAPYARVADIARAYDHFRSLVGGYLAEHGARVVSAGYHPTRRAFDLELIPKKRYGYMNDYFVHHIHTHGERMMRASASTQVSVDFSSEADGVRKLRVASALAPVFAAIADDAPVYEGEPNSEPLTRFRLWRDVDNARCGVIPGIFSSDFSFEAYADWLLGTSPIFVLRPAEGGPSGPDSRAAYGETAAEAYAAAPLSTGDMVQIGSMFWPDARLKRFVEVRPADCMPRDQALGYAALIKGLFYSEASLAGVEERLGVADGVWPLTPGDVDAAVASICTHGFAGDVYGSTLAEWEQLLFGLARAALPEDERAYLGPLEEFAADKPWRALAQPSESVGRGAGL